MVGLQLKAAHMNKQQADIACYRLAIEYLCNEPHDSDEARDALAAELQQAAANWFVSSNDTGK
jgi:hypothetical protein